MTESPYARLCDAAAYAARLHAGQTRKGTTIPYFSHLLSVAALVLEHGGDEDAAIAGLLHDALEDCGLEHLEEIRRRYGERSAAIVVACTDGTPDASGDKGPWAERKAAYLEHLKEVDETALLVSACDKLHNARAIAADLRCGVDVFSRFNAPAADVVAHYAALREVFAARLGPRSSLVLKMDAALGVMRGS